MPHLAHMEAMAVKLSPFARHWRTDLRLRRGQQRLGDFTRNSTPVTRRESLCATWCSQETTSTYLVSYLHGRLRLKVARRTRLDTGIKPLLRLTSLRHAAEICVPCCWESMMGCRTLRALTYPPCQGTPTMESKICVGATCLHSFEAMQSSMPGPLKQRVTSNKSVFIASWASWCQCWTFPPRTLRCTSVTTLTIKHGELRLPCQACNLIPTARG